ncbi:MAG: DUF262 domain-containing protein [Pseudobdellovibrio sp.]
MSTITPHYQSVTQLLQGRSFGIDEYQREYKWEKKHIEELIVDIHGKFNSCYKNGDETKQVSNYDEYFLGSIIVTKRNGKSYLIDGQQRVTSITLLLIYLYRAAKEQGLTVVETMAKLIFSDSFGEQKFNLDIQERLPVIDALFNGKEFNPEDKDESIQSMYSRYKDIEDYELVKELGESLPHFIYWFMNKVCLIEIVSENDNYAYSIFETMNDRGKPLSPVDMLKAYLLAPFEDTEKKKIANSEWKKQILELISWKGHYDQERDSNFIKAWLRSQYANSIRERKAGSIDKDWELIGSVFHRWSRDNSSKIEIGNQEKNLMLMTEHLPFFAKAFRIILDASSNYEIGLESVFYNAHNDFTWQNTVLMSSLQVNDDEKTVRRKIGVVATYLDIWLMRRVVNYIRVGYSSTSYAMFKLCTDIRRKSLPDLIDILTEKLNEDEITFEGVEAKNRGGIEELGLNQFSRRYIYHLLARLTAFVEKESGRVDEFQHYVNRKAKNPYDIEHIWADKSSKNNLIFNSEQEFVDIRNNIGSLLLLPADVNRSYQDKSFADKAPHYAKQNFFAASLTSVTYKHQPQFEAFMNRFSLNFKPFEKFGVEEQKSRKTLVRNLANQIWSPERLKSYLN